MALCPKCSHPLDTDFGLVTCSNCQQVVFFDMDGNPQLSPEINETPVEIPNETHSEDVNTHEQNASFESFDHPIEPTGSENFFSGSVEDSSRTPEPGLPPRPQSPPFQNPSSVAKGKLIQEISAESSEPTAFYSYNLTIEGIDSKELTERVSEELTDSKLKIEDSHWNQQIWSGKIELKKLNGVKVSILLKRLNRYPLKLNWQQILSLIFISMLAYTSSSPASEGAAPAEAESGGHGDSDAAGGSGAKGPKLPEWADLMNRIAGTKAKIAAKQEQISKLIEEKNHMSKSDPHLRSIIDELKKEHQELTELNKEYEKQKTRYNYRFPEKGLKEMPQFQSMEIKPLNELEKDKIVDTELNKTLKKMRNTYGDTREKIKAKPKSEKRAPASETSEDDLDIEGVIIYRK